LDVNNGLDICFVNAHPNAFVATITWALSSIQSCMFYPFPLM
jgi:hypothetical protein